MSPGFLKKKIGNKIKNRKNLTGRSKRQQKDNKKDKIAYSFHQAMYDWRTLSFTNFPNPASTGCHLSVQLAGPYTTDTCFYRKNLQRKKIVKEKRKKEEGKRERRGRGGGERKGKEERRRKRERRRGEERRERGEREGRERREKAKPYFFQWFFKI